MSENEAATEARSETDLTSYVDKQIDRLVALVVILATAVAFLVSSSWGILLTKEPLMISGGQVSSRIVVGPLWTLIAAVLLLLLNTTSALFSLLYNQARPMSASDRQIKLAAAIQKCRDNMWVGVFGAFILVGLAFFVFALAVAVHTDLFILLVYFVIFCASLVWVANGTPGKNWLEKNRQSSVAAVTRFFRMRKRR